MSEIIPTVVPKSSDAIAELASRFEGVAPTLHIDATDGDFAFPTTWLPAAGAKLPQFDGIYEAHVMVRDARRHGEMFARAGAWRIIAHAESLGTADEARRTIDLWRVCGAKESGAALLLGSPIDALEKIAPLVDCIHVMTIAKVGAQGAKFDERAVQRVRDVHARFPLVTISVDGGVNETNIAELSQAGATRFCVGAALTQATDPLAQYQVLQSLIDNAIQ